MLGERLTPDEARVNGFSSPQECLAALAAKPCDLLIVDLGACEQDGLDMLEHARRMTPWLSSLAIVEHAAVSCAIRAIKAGAGDCLDKPVEPDRLLAAVGNQLARVTVSTRHPKALTAMEIQILHLILAGRTSHDIAAELHRSKRTIDVHRKNIMRKLQATCFVDLVKRALGMGFTESPKGTKDAPEPGAPNREPPPDEDRDAGPPADTPSSPITGSDLHI
ncbi:MAG: LuxR C-terminal-related transcriptional regulator [Planctomycetes bacterium]|jgi:DNA-binding NarL/FixJ family response regulator|nr:LuxR C-terminal-related transcriptional regulator [Planctomycetota bacterium]